MGGEKRMQSEEGVKLNMYSTWLPMSSYLCYMQYVLPYRCTTRSSSYRPDIQQSKHVVGSRLQALSKG